MKDRISIKHVEGSQKILFVIFSAHSKNNKFDLWYDLPFDAHKLFLLDKSRNWYFCCGEVVKKISKLIDRIKPKYIIGVGSSSGASASIYYGSILRFDEIHAFGPVSIFDPFILRFKGDDRWQSSYCNFEKSYNLKSAVKSSKSNIHVYFCGKSLDKIHAEYLLDLNKNINIHEINCKVHRVLEYSKLTKRLNPILGGAYYGEIFKGIKSNASITINNETKLFGEIWRDAQNICNNFKTSRDRDVILITGKTSFASIEYFIASILCNLIPCFIPYQTTKVSKEVFEKRIQNAINVSGAKFFVDENGSISSITSHVNAVSPLNPSTIFMQMSSGTTNLPKVFEVSSQSLIEQVNNYSQSLEFTSSDSIVSWLPLYHDMGLIACLFMPLLIGSNIYLIDPFDWIANPYLLFRQIEKYKPTHIWMPNFAFSILSKLKNNNNLSSIKKWISCSEVTRYKDIYKFCEKLGINTDKVNVCYAMAENIFAVSHQNGLKIHDGHVSCGKCIPGSKCLIKVDNNGVPDGVIGNIYIDSNYLVTGINRPYLTGDVGFAIDGDVYVVGRSDDMIIHTGKNISPYEIEHIIGEISGIKEGRVACFGVFDENFGTERIVVCAERNDSNPLLLSEIDIIRIIRESVGVSISLYIKDIGWIVKTSSGKISRKSTREKFLLEHK